MVDKVSPWAKIWLTPAAAHPTDAFPDLSNSPILVSGTAQETVSQSQSRSGSYDSRYPNLLLQLDSRPLSQEQLALEVKAVYDRLKRAELRCIHLHLAAFQGCSLNWRYLISLHNTLLHHYADFFLVSRHHSASPGLRGLADKFSIPARMWKYGIHSFLELLRLSLPGSIEYMLTFIYEAYQMMGLLSETAPAFEVIWIECLGHLSRYRMVVENKNSRDHELWKGVAQSCYSRAADTNPIIGRLYYHLAVLADPNALQQFYYYARSLTSVEMFPQAREAILDHIPSRFPNHIDEVFIQAHITLFRKQEGFQDTQFAFESQLDAHIGRVTIDWREQGAYIAIINLAGLFDYGSSHSVLRQVLILHGKHLTQPATLSSQPDSHSSSPVEQNISSQTLSDSEVLADIETDTTFSNAYLLTLTTLTLVLERIGDKNVLPHVHVLLSFFLAVASIKRVAWLIDSAPWIELVSFLNDLLESEQQSDKISISPVFPVDPADRFPLPEDDLIRGQIWSQWYFPEGWFEKKHEDRPIELLRTEKLRTERVLRLGNKLASFGRWLSYGADSRFSVSNLSGSS